jgi:hypothetical protein
LTTIYVKYTYQCMLNAVSGISLYATYFGGGEQTQHPTPHRAPTH